MKLTKEENELIKDWWNSDLDIEIERTKYTAILESNVYYNHHSDGSYDRKKGDKRKLDIYINKFDDVFELISFYNNDSFSSSVEAISFLQNNGDLRKLAHAKYNLAVVK